MNNEIYEMLRLLSSDRSKTDIGKLEDISIEVNLPADNDDVNCLFNNTETQNVLIVSTLDIIANCREQSSSVDFLGADDTESAKSIVHNNELSFAIVDLSLGERGDSELLNRRILNQRAGIFFGISARTCRTCRYMSLKRTPKH